MPLLECEKVKEEGGREDSNLRLVSGGKPK